MLDRETWLRLIFKSVRDIADEAFQEKAWFGKGDDVSSPNEVYCQLFDDYGFERYFQTYQDTLTPEQQAVWLTLDKSLDLFSEDSLDPYLVFPRPSLA